MNNYDYNICSDCKSELDFLDLTKYLIMDIQHLEEEVVRLRYSLSKLLPSHEGHMLRCDIFHVLSMCYHDYPAYQKYISVYHNGHDPLDSRYHTEQLLKLANGKA